MEQKFPNRKLIRMQKHDYSQPGAYFITICTKDKKCILAKSVIDNLEIPKLQLTHCGAIIDKNILKIGEFYDNVKINHYVIMPNHIHFIIEIYAKGQGIDANVENTHQNSTVSKLVSTFKRLCNREYGKNIWQPRSNDHIIRDKHDYEKHVRYIYKNPMRWIYDDLYFEE